MLERKEILSGFGHPLYRAYDPRAVILKRISEDFSHDGGEPDWYAITEAAERTVFEEKGLYPNVDLYSGSVYRYLGIRPTCSRRSSPRVALPGGRPTCSSSTPTTRSFARLPSTWARRAAPFRRATARLQGGASTDDRPAWLRAPGDLADVAKTHSVAPAGNSGARIRVAEEPKGDAAQ
jgi:hypothetical protein